MITIMIMTSNSLEVFLPHIYTSRQTDLRFTSVPPGSGDPNHTDPNTPPASDVK